MGDDVRQASTETSAFARRLMAKLGLNAPILLGNASTGETAPLPPHIADLVRQMLSGLAAGRRVTITDDPADLTAPETAKFLNVSLAFVSRLIEEGKLPCRSAGGEQRIPYPEIIAFRDEQRARSRAALEELYRIDAELGLNDMDGPPPARDVVHNSGGR